MQEGEFSFLELEAILNNLSDSDKKSEWFIIFNGIDDDDYIQYANLKNGIIMDWPYNIKNTKRNNAQFLKVISEFRIYNCKFKKRKNKTNLRYGEYWIFKEYNKENKTISKIIDLNIEKDYKIIISNTIYYFKKIFDYDRDKLKKIRIKIGIWENK